MLYWTDRGDAPNGNKVSRTPIDTTPAQAILLRHLGEVFIASPSSAPASSARAGPPTTSHAASTSSRLIQRQTPRWSVSKGGYDDLIHCRPLDPRIWRRNVRSRRLRV